MAVPPRCGVFSFTILAPLVLVWLCRHAMKSSLSKYCTAHRVLWLCRHGMEYSTFIIRRPLVLLWLYRHAMKSFPSQSGAPWSYGCAATVWSLLHNLVPPGLMAVLPHYGVFSTIRRPLVSWVCRYGMASFPSQSNGIRYSIRQD